MIGCICRCGVFPDFGSPIPLGIPEEEAIFLTGHVVFLPPTTKISNEEGIDLIINMFSGNQLKESPPIWEKNINIPPLGDLEENLAQKQSEKVKIEEKIKGLEKRIKEKKEHRKLLWTKGKPLEDKVHQAFKFLGFPEIRRRRSGDLEDGVFNFKINTRFKYGVLEIKGRDKKTSLSDLTQCNKWIEDYLLENIEVKGIFVANQYRLKDPQKSKKNREQFEPNELKYAKERKICILTSHEIFNAVVEKMKNNPKITRKNIEQKIASAKGLCELT
jgi:hypothetical protein